MKVKILEDSVAMFTLLFHAEEVKEGVKDDPWELEKLKRQQVDNNFDNWLPTSTVFYGYGDAGPA